jgi:hypothetical protein
MAHTPATRDKFLKALADTGLVNSACEIAGIDKKTAYNWRNSDEDFAAAWAEAIDKSTSLLEDEATRRAMDKSDNLLMFMLKSRDPKYRDRSTQDVNIKGKMDVVTLLQQGRERVRDV